MVLYSKSIGPLVLRLLAALLLLGWPRMSSAAGTWSVISLPQQPGEVIFPTGVAVDDGGNLYVADQGNGGRIQKRDALGNWSVLAIAGEATGQVQRDVIYPMAVAVDGVGNLYVADQSTRGRIQKRDAEGNWSVIAPFGYTLGQVAYPTALAVDTAGNLYAADQSIGGGIQKRDARGHWSLIAPQGAGPGQVSYPNALAVDAAGNLYVGDAGNGVGRIQKRDTRGDWSILGTQGSYGLAVDTMGNLYVNGGDIQKRDPQGNWSLIATSGPSGQIVLATALAVDTAGSLYVADRGRGGRIQKRDTQGNWSLTAAVGSALGQVFNPSAAAVDTTGNLYVADGGPAGIGRAWSGGTLSRIQKRNAEGNWSVLATAGTEVGQVSEPSAVVVDRAGNLYVADRDDLRIQQRDAQGNWSVIAPEGPIPLGGYEHSVGGSPIGLAVDSAGNLYIADQADDGRIQKRDPQGNWSVIATEGDATGQVHYPSALVVDTANNLYVADFGTGRIQKWDTQGHWSVIAAATTTISPTLSPDQVINPSGVAVDAVGNLYVADMVGSGQIHERDARGNWSFLASSGSGYLPGQVLYPGGLAVDAAGHLYVADTGNNRVLKYTASGGQ